MPRPVLLVIVCGVLLSGCGDTGGGGDGFFVFRPTLVEEATVVSDVPTGGAVTEIVVPPPIQVGAGLGANIRIHRAVFSFDLTSLPDGATIDSATLYMHQYNVIGSPYAQMGDLVVDHVDLGAGLDVADFDGGTIVEAFATLSSSPAIATYTVEVKERVEVDLFNGRTVSSFRIYFVTDESATVNQQLVSLADTQGGGPSNVDPMLLVDYRVGN